MSFKIGDIVKIDITNSIHQELYINEDFIILNNKIGIVEKEICIYTPMDSIFYNTIGVRIDNDNWTFHTDDLTILDNIYNFHKGN